MFTVAWWYLLGTLALTLTGLFAGVVGFYAAIALCLVQAIHFGIEDKNFFSFSCQVRYVLVVIFIAGFWEPLRWIYWIPVVGLTARLTLNYCLLARIVSLLPWNRKQPFSWELFKRTIFSSPSKFRIQC